jgi:general secretion pathway protein B
MSFILDALKKSETDRQRQNGPALFEVRVAPPRDKLPLWAIGLGVLLAVNLVIVAWVLLRRPAAPETAAPPTASAMQPAQAGAAPVYSTNMAPGAPMGPPQGQAYPPAPNTVPVNGAPPTAPMAQAAGMTQPAPVGNAMTPPAAPSPGGQPVAGSTAVAPVAANDSQGAAGDAAEKGNPDDYAPAADPGPPKPFGNHVSRSTASGVPLYQDVASASHLPSLRLDLHVYATNPQDRFVMINMHKLHEGDAMAAEGVRVESITPSGAVLSHDGTRFVLPRD